MDILIEKTCSTCEGTFAVSEFTVDRQRKDGFRPQCKKCSRSRPKTHDPEYYREKARRYRLENPEKVKEFQKLWRISNPEVYKESARRTHLRTTFNISLEEYNELFEKQGKACAICKGTSPQDSMGRSFCVDHNHITGEIRGILCFRCNKALGWFRDDERLLEKALSYLRGE